MESMASKSDAKTPTDLQTEATAADSKHPADSLPTTGGTSSQSQVPKPRSMPWSHFTKIDSGDKAKCNHCQALISCRSKFGSSTSAMLNHIRRCKMLQPEIADEEHEGKRLKQTTMHHQFKKGNEMGKGSSFLTFNQHACRLALARWFIIDEVPFRSVEREGFREAMSVIQPRLTLPSRRTLVRDCLSIYDNEKLKLQKFLRNHKYSVCLTTDLWTSRQNLSYISLTAHFIDDYWNLQKKILNFSPIYGHSGLAIGKKVEECVKAWKLENIFSITVDNASANDVGLRYLKDRLQVLGIRVPLNGELMHMRCGCHILNLVVRDGLDELKDSIERIRSAVLYVRSSSLRTKKFKECIEIKKLHTNMVASLYVDTRWNSTYTMLDSALRLKPAFDCLEFEDDKYREELTKHGKEPPSEEDWLYARGFLPFLKCFYETTVKISGSKYATGNLYMKEIFKVAYTIQRMGSSGDETVRLVASKMGNKFFKYWGDWRHVNPLIYIATILDPRCKMRWFSFLVNRVYPNDEAKELMKWIEKTLQRLFTHYDSLAETSKNLGSSSRTEYSYDKDFSDVDDFDEALQKEYETFEAIEGQCVVKSELDKYLSDECEKSQLTNFEVLYWWRTAGSKYATLSRMARDVLAIPVSTVASESAFSTGGRVIDPFRSSLTPKLVETLVCAQDWIRSGDGPTRIEEAFEDIERLQEALEAGVVDDEE